MSIPRPARSRTSLVEAGFLLCLSLAATAPLLLAGSDRQVAGADLGSFFYPRWAFAREELAQGRIPLWNPYQFSGEPFLADPQMALFYPPTWLVLLAGDGLGTKLDVGLHIWLSMLGMLVFTRRMCSLANVASEFGCRVGGLVAAISYGLSGATGVRWLSLGHVTLISTYTWLPWSLAALAWSCAAPPHRALAAAFVSGLPLALAILAGHPGTMVYVALAWLVFALYLAAFHHGPRRVVRQVFVAVAAALLLAGVQVLATGEFVSNASSKASVESPLSRAIGSVRPPDLVGLVVPDLWSLRLQDPSWIYAVHPFYPGVLAFSSIVLGLYRPSRTHGLYVALIAVGLVIGLGEHGSVHPLFRHVPILDKTRIAGRALLLYTFAASALFGHVVARFASSLSRRQCRLLFGGAMASVVLLAGVSMLALASQGSQPWDQTVEAFRRTEFGYTRVKLGLAEVLRAQLEQVAIAAVLALGGLGSLWRIARGRGRTLAAALLVGLVLLDLGRLYVERLEIRPVRTPWWAGVDELHGERVWLWTNLATPEHVRDSGGYNPLVSSSYQEFMREYRLSDPLRADLSSAGWDIASIRYGAVLGAHGIQATERIRPIFEGRGGSVFERSNVPPLARLVYRAIASSEVGQPYRLTSRPEFDPHSMVIVDRIPSCMPRQPPQHPGHVQVLDEHPGYGLYRVSSPTSALLMVAENLYPGWQVEVDDRPAQPIAAFGTFRAVCVPPGEHEVTWRFTPGSVRIGASLSVFGLLLLGLAVAVLWRCSGSRDGTHAERSTPTSAPSSLTSSPNNRLP